MRYLLLFFVLFASINLEAQSNKIECLDCVQVRDSECYECSDKRRSWKIVDGIKVNGEILTHPLKITGDKNAIHLLGDNGKRAMILYSRKTYYYSDSGRNLLPKNLILEAIKVCARGGVEPDILIDNGDGSFTHTSTDGIEVTWGVSLVDNGDGTFSLVDINNNVLGTCDKGWTEVSYDGDTNSFIFTYPDGTEVPVLLPTDILVNNNNGTWTHTSVDGTVEIINTTQVVDNGDGTGTITDSTGDVIDVCIAPCPTFEVTQSPDGLDILTVTVGGDTYIIEDTHEDCDWIKADIGTSTGAIKYCNGVPVDTIIQQSVFIQNNIDGTVTIASGDSTAVVCAAPCETVVDTIPSPEGDGWVLQIDGEDIGCIPYKKSFECEDLLSCVGPTAEDDYVIEPLPRDSTACYTVLANDNHVIAENFAICGIESVSPSTASAALSTDVNGDICITTTPSTQEDIEVMYKICDDTGQEDTATLYVPVCDGKGVGGDNQAFVVTSGDPSSLGPGTTGTLTFGDFTVPYSRPTVHNNVSDLLGGITQAPNCAIVERTLAGVTFFDIRHVANESIELCAIKFDNNSQIGDINTTLAVLTNTGQATWGYPNEIAPAVQTFLQGAMPISEIGTGGFLFDAQAANWMSFHWSCEDNEVPLPIEFWFKHSCDPTVPIILTLKPITFYN